MCTCYAHEAPLSFVGAIHEGDIGKVIDSLCANHVAFANHSVSHVRTKFEDQLTEFRNQIVAGQWCAKDLTLDGMVINFFSDSGPKTWLICYLILHGSPRGTGMPGYRLPESSRLD
jgi:hypothetical protein